MATWQAECWLGSASGYQTLQVQANTYAGAEQQLRRIYGAERIINLKQVNGLGGVIKYDMPEGTAYATALGNLFNVIGILIVLLFKGIVRLSRYIAKASRSRV